MKSGQHDLRIAALFLAVILLISPLSFGVADVVSGNPLLTVQPLGPYVQTPQRFLNILFIGIDYIQGGYRNAGYKRTLENSHTDAIMVLSINLDERVASLISLPRDSFTYVPGVRGIYKLNAAINCADTIDEGLRLACDAVSWHLGGVQVEKYIAVDYSAMIMLGDAIGGVDFDLEMSYMGTKYYREGFQHLDGQGMTDYVRARTNATIKGDDLGRTERQRKMMMAVFSKIKDNPLLVTKVVNLTQNRDMNVYTNITTTEMISILALYISQKVSINGNYVLTGPYMNFIKNFTFNDPLHRQEVIREVYGIDAPPIQYVSYEYSRWLINGGLTSAKYINIGKELLAHAKAGEIPTIEQQDALYALETAYDATVLAFDAAAESMTKSDMDILKKARAELQKRGKTVARLFNYPDRITWERNSLWYMDQFINERMLNWN